jgi:hypothetical protein
MNRRKAIREVAFWSFLAAIGLSYFGPVLGDGRSFLQKGPDGYYGALTDSFLSGQLSMKEEPDPRLLKAENPYVDQVDVPRPHDMSLYKGKLYLYFGAAPVVILYLPWRLVTGSWLAERNGTIIFCFAGMVLAATLLRRTKDRYFEACGDVWLWLGIAVLAWGSPIYYLARNETFYAVPISSAFCCIMLVLVATDRASTSQTCVSGYVWTALASLAYGFAVASRPNYIYGLPLLLLAGLYLGARQYGTGRQGKRWAFLAASIVPAVLVGAAIAAYNFKRFESPFEFGMRFQLMPEDMRHTQLIGTAHLGTNLFSYLFRLAHYVRYYPFFLIDRAYGVVPYLPFILLGLILLAPFIYRAPVQKPGGLVVLCGMIFGIFACNLLSLGLYYYFGELRYMTDFAPAALLLGAIGAMALMDRVHGARPSARRIAGTSVALLALFSVGNGLFATLQASPGTTIAASLASRLDYLPFWAEREAGTKQGAIEMDVSFPTGRAGRFEPLLSTGIPGQGDIVYIEYLEGSRARMGFFHLGSGGPTSDDFAVTPGVHDVELSLGSLYPPREHPLFKGYPGKYVESLKRRLEVTVDGKPVLAASARFYFSTPGLLYLGANPIAPNVSGPVFTGQISNVRRLGLPTVGAVLAQSNASGPLRLHVRFPKGRSGPGEPLVSTGSKGAGDIFLVTYLGGDRIRFGLENAGSVLATDPVSVDFDREHVIDLEMGSLYPPDADFAGLSPDEIRRTRSRYSVRLDGRLLIMESRAFQPSEADQVVLAMNTIGASTAVETFSGTIAAAERIEPDAPRGANGWGPLDAWVLLPSGATGLAEPLVASGVAGRGDVIFVKYDDPGHVHFGFDHWSVGGPIGESVAVDFGKVHHLEVSMGSLYPPLGDLAWHGHPEAQMNTLKGTVRVTMDGAVVLDAALPSFDARPEQIALWANPIGASSCRDAFTGTVLESRKTEW